MKLKIENYEFEGTLDEWVQAEPFFAKFRMHMPAIEEVLSGWNEDENEDRNRAIAQNGNDGEHYDEVPFPGPNPDAIPTEDELERKMVTGYAEGSQFLWNNMSWQILSERYVEELNSKLYECIQVEMAGGILLTSNKKNFKLNSDNEMVPV